MIRPIPTKLDPMARILAGIAAALSGNPTTETKPLSTLGMPTAYPTPRKNHAKGMRRKARVEGRRFFTVRGRRRRI